MKHVSILLLDHVNIGSMENARLGLLEANTFQKLNGMEDYFKVELVGIRPEVNLYNGAFTIRADKTLDQVSNTDLIIIPPVQQDLASGIQDNEAFCPWIKEQYEKGTEIASLCLGAFILGNTGLLNGRKCVTHWKATGQFKRLFPDTQLLPDKLLTDDAGIYTGGGAFSSANLILYVIEKYLSREAAIYCSKIFQIDMGRNAQSEFIIFTGQKDHSDDQVKTVQEYVERNFPEKFSVEFLCEKFFLSRRTLERRFKYATGNTLLEYLQRVRVEAAKRNLEKTNKTVSEIMYDVGYSDSKSFREVFKKYSGLSPLEYKSKYGLN
ncbi:GlxA family transcriptional regulator [Cecembia rubra]|uniref:AraC family transcriptional regulator with amidase-like domain n=1 Tax=Cecembia rubra TaxID=1485585 RepID=A0A2P8ECG5_9BACT|nr:helix-turn-helix domain-containing protein [Cecembia rubra]PSL07166.1 AraC family transcriptional regulator with amidase-like domain [Cecembia rubra]